MYLILISVSLCILYFVLFFIFPELFNQERRKIESSSFVSILLILLLSFLGYFIAFNISDTELSNRFLHGFGGGFMAFLVCFLIVRDTRLKINKFQFFVLSILIVTALGATNEILEFFLQNYVGFVFATTINDTWLDLISNAVGSLLATGCFVPFINRS
jgi:Sec-independent protein secretion pathway component TatC